MSQERNRPLFLFVNKENSIFVGMKHLLHTIIAISFLLATGCAADRSPHTLAKHFYKSIANGDYDKALACTTMNEDIDLELYHAVMDKVSRSIETKGGVKKIEIIDEQIADDNMSAIVVATITYADGTVDKEYCDVIKQDDKWVVDVELYSK